MTNAYSKLKADLKSAGVTLRSIARDLRVSHTAVADVARGARRSKRIEQAIAETERSETVECPLIRSDSTDAAQNRIINLCKRTAHRAKNEHDRCADARDLVWRVGCRCEQDAPA